MKKNVMKVLMILSLVLFTSCTSMFSKSRVEEVKYTPEQAKEWEKTLVESIKKNALIPEWYGNEKPIIYLRRTGKMDEKEFKFLESLKTKEQITQDDLDKFDSLVLKYNEKLEREFWIEVENVKDGKSIVKKMVEDSKSRGTNPSKHIKEIMDTKDWNKIVAWSQKADLDEDDIDDLTDILNELLEMDTFFSRDSWLNVEVSERTADLVRLDKIKEKSDLELNNLNAKALYVAYSEYLSKMDRWND